MNNRHSDTQRKKKTKNRHTPPIISCGTKEKIILRHLLNNKKEWFNIRQFSIINKIPRPTIYDKINKLISKGLVKKTDDNNKVITRKGERYLGVGSVGNKPRGECRTGQLSTHYIKYKLDAKDINRHRVSELSPQEIKVNKLKNFEEYYLYFEDHTIVIKLNCIYIHIPDIISESTEEAHFEAFAKAIKICKELKKIAKINNLILENAHYARVESQLAKVLFKIDNRFFLDLGDGEKFWIDMSDKLEDETNSSEYRERLDIFLKDLKTSSSLMTDVDAAINELDKIKEVLSKQINLNNGLLKFQANQIIPMEEKEDNFQKDIHKYFG